MRSMSSATGWYGRPSVGKQQARVTRYTHYVTASGPVCGYKPHPTMKFQFCAHGIHLDYIDCPGCKKFCSKIGSKGN